MEFPLTEGIKELEISSVYTGVRDNTNESVLFVERTGIENNSIQCRYGKCSFKKTARELELVLTEAGSDVKLTRKLIALFSKIWRQTSNKSCAGNILEIKVMPADKANSYLQRERCEYQIFSNDPVKIMNNDVYVPMVKRSQSFTLGEPRT